MIQEQQATVSNPWQPVSRARKVLAVFCVLLWLVPRGISLAYGIKTVSSHVIVGGVLAGILTTPVLKIKNILWLTGLFGLFLLPLLSFGESSYRGDYHRAGQFVDGVAFVCYAVVLAAVWKIYRAEELREAHRLQEVD